MDTSAESLMSNTVTSEGGPVPAPDLSGPLDCAQSNRSSTILLQLLDFKTHLQEAVEELHTRRDAAVRFEEQIGKLVSENRELEWAKERLQHQSETVAKQHRESMNSAEKKFQAKMKSIEEEKGKYEASVEIKDKEINSLKAELKSAQLLKVNLETKISGLEQTLLLQNTSKENQLRKLGDVEKRFSILSRQCAALKQAHEKLEQSVDEAVRRNVQLAAANAKQEQIIASLAKETKMMKTFMEENEVVRREKLEVVRALQHSQQLLLSQTQAASRAELELQTEAEQHQALKQEHEVMRERSKTLEDKLAQLSEKCAARQRGWDEEKAELLGNGRRAPKDLHKQEAEKRGSSQSCPVVARLPPADSVEDVGAAGELAGVPGGPNAWNHRQQLQFKPVNPQNQLAWAADGQSEDARKAGETAQTRDAASASEDAKNNQEAGTGGNATAAGEETGRRCSTTGGR